MGRVLHARKIGRLKRMEFLKEWGKLREKLAKTPEYRKLRRTIFARAGGKCGKCGGEVGRSGVVHHKVPVAWNPALALSVSNCICVCQPCHVEIHPFLKQRSDSTNSVL